MNSGVRQASWNDASNRWGTVAQDDPVVGEARTMPQLDTTFSDALHSPLFLKLTFGYFV